MFVTADWKSELSHNGTIWPRNQDNGNIERWFCVEETGFRLPFIFWFVHFWRSPALTTTPTLAAAASGAAFIYLGFEGRSLVVDT